MAASLLAKLGLPGFAPEESRHYAVIGNFDSPEDLLRAIRTARAAGYSKMEDYTPFPIHGIDEARKVARETPICLARSGSFNKR